MRLAWSRLAHAELADIRRYSVERWGRAVAVRYLQDLRDAAKAEADPARLRMLGGPYRIRGARSHCLILHVDPATALPSRASCTREWTPSDTSEHRQGMIAATAAHACAISQPMPEPRPRPRNCPRRTICYM